jgi:four helix bundle protein
MIKRFEDIVAWQYGRALCREIYLITERQPFARDFALRDQIRRAAISVPSNIAEGFERFRPAEFHQFLSIAKGSLGELRTQLYIAGDIGYLDDETQTALFEAASVTATKIGALRASIERRKNNKA